MPENKKTSGFRWSLRPLDVCARIATGVSLGLCSRQSFLTRSSGFIFGFLILMSNLYLNGPRIARFKWMEARLKYESAWSFLQVRPDAILQLSMDIGYMLLYLSNPLVHCIFLCVVFSSRWTQLKSILNYIQMDMQLSGTFHRKCRKKTVFWLLILITDAAVFVRKYEYDNFYVADEKWKAEQEDLDEFYITISKSPLPFLAAIWARLIDICILFVYAGFSCLAAEIFVDIEEKASEIMDTNYQFPCCCQSFSLKLEEIRKHYELASTLVETIDNCFGLVLLVNTAKAYATSIYEFCSILMTGGKYMKRYPEFVHTVIRFIVIMFPSFFVAQKGKDLACSIRGFSYMRHNADVQFQMNTVILQISELPNPGISASEIVHFNDLSGFFLLLDTSFQYGATIFGSTVESSDRDEFFYLTRRQQGSFVNQLTCPNGEKYLPCLCKEFGNFFVTYAFDITCANVTMKETQRIFKSTAPVDIVMMILAIRDSSFIPKDILGLHSAQYIILYGHLFRGNSPLEIHSQAFRSSRNLKELTISDYELGSVNFGFLGYFQELQTFQIWSCQNVSLSSVPFLPRLTNLVMFGNRGIKDLFIFPKEMDTPERKGMKVEFQQNEMNDEEATWILDWLYTNMILGGYNVSFVSLRGNNLTKLSSNSYKKILKWMEANHHSVFDLVANPFDCSDACELAWLIRDNRHLLLPMMAYRNDSTNKKQPICSNGTSFLNLDPEGVRNCPKDDEI